VTRGRKWHTPEILEAHSVAMQEAGGRRDEEEGPARVLSRGPVIIVLRFLPRITRFEIEEVTRTFLSGLDSRVDFRLF